MTTMMLYSLIIICLGGFDIYCALCILKIINNPQYEKWALSIYENTMTEKDQRFIAYIIFIFGFIRVLCGCNVTGNIKYVLCSTYFIEEVYVVYEYINYKTIKKHSAIIIGIGAVLMCLSILYLF